MGTPGVDKHPCKASTIKKGFRKSGCDPNAALQSQSISSTDDNGDNINTYMYYQTIAPDFTELYAQFFKDEKSDGFTNE